ncbi:MAG: FHA domain-containing protein [Lachnospiraceae bacterium]|nr:FHA domain-containing protein [Lachnospiraceae bacterium]
MELLRCVNGHFYDGEENKECPYCKEMSKENLPTVPSDVLRYMGGQEQEITKSESEKSTGYYGNKQPVTGWLVCISGRHYGESFELKCGVNFVGRERCMDVALTKDDRIAGEKHVIICYEPKEKRFTVQMGDSKETVYVNDEVLAGSAELNAYDHIGIGDSIMMIVPLCGDRFDWE